MESGTKLGPCAIDDQIGAGGMGEVWKAMDTKLWRKVAIKTLPRAGLRPPARLQNAPTVTFSPLL